MRMRGSKGRHSQRGRSAWMGALLGLWMAVAGAADEDVPPPVDLNPDQAALAGSVKGEVMSPCCWHGTVDHHNSPLARQLAGRIDHWVAEGKTQDAILDSLVAEYGERILARPRREGFGLWFYVGPAVLVSAAGVMLSRWLKRQSGQIAAASATAGTQATSSIAPAGPTHGEKLDLEFEAALKRLDG